MEPNGERQLLDGTTAGVAYLLEDRRRRVPRRLTHGPGRRNRDRPARQREKAFGRRRIQDVLALSPNENANSSPDWPRTTRTRTSPNGSACPPRRWKPICVPSSRSRTSTRTPEGHRRVLAVLRLPNATQ